MKKRPLLHNCDGWDGRVALKEYDEENFKDCYKINRKRFKTKMPKLLETLMQIFEGNFKEKTIIPSSVKVCTVFSLSIYLNKEDIFHIYKLLSIYPEPHYWKDFYFPAMDKNSLQCDVEIFPKPKTFIIQLKRKDFLDLKFNFK